MIRVLTLILRVIGYGVLAISIVAGISDASSSIALSEVQLTPLGRAWFDFSPETLNLSQAVIQRYVHPAVWDPAIQTILTWPVWAVLGPLGLLLVWLGTRRRRQKVQFA